MNKKIHPVGIEPTSMVPETIVLSVELWVPWIGIAEKGRVRSLPEFRCLTGVAFVHTFKQEMLHIGSSGRIIALGSMVCPP